MYEIRASNRFKKQLKLCQKRGLDTSLLRDAVRILAEIGALSPSYRSHKLSGEYEG